MHFYQVYNMIIWQLREILSISPHLELLIKCNLCTALTRLRMIGQMPYCQRPPSFLHSMEGGNKLNLRGKSTPFSILVKNKYFKISKLCKHVPLLLFNFHAYGLFTDWKIQIYYFVLLMIFFSSPPWNVFAPLQPAHQHSATPDKDLTTYCRHGQDN